MQTHLYAWDMNYLHSNSALFLQCVQFSPANLQQLTEKSINAIKNS